MDTYKELGSNLNHYYKKIKLKFKIDWISLILFILGFILIIPSVLINRYIFLLVAFSFSLAFVFFLRFLDKRKIEIFNLLEEFLKKEATNSNMLSLNTIYPLFLKVDDLNEDFQIYLDKELIFNSNFKNIKNYSLYTNSLSYKQNQRIKVSPKIYIKKYLIKIETFDSNSLILTFKNNNLKFIIGGKYYYEQSVNANTINALATILDKIFIKNKKKKQSYS